MSNGFQFGDKGTWDFDLYVQHRPKQKIPARRVQTFIVPGRSGALHQTQYAWEPITKSYDCYFHGKEIMPVQAHAIKAWLCADAGPRKLWDVYDPDYFYWATFHGSADIGNRLNRYGVVTLNFLCDPRAFLTTGEQEILFSEPGELHNPTAFAARPVITVQGAGSGNVYVGGTTVKILDMEDEIILDCEIMDAYRQPGEGAKEDKNGAISAPVFPQLLSGKNTVSWDGGIQSLAIVPRWWTL